MCPASSATLCGDLADAQVEPGEIVDADDSGAFSGGGRGGDVGHGLALFLGFLRRGLGLGGREGIFRRLHHGFHLLGIDAAEQRLERVDGVVVQFGARVVEAVDRRVEEALGFLHRGRQQRLEQPVGIQAMGHSEGPRMLGNRQIFQPGLRWPRF